MIQANGEKIEFWDVFPVLDATTINQWDACFWDTVTNSLKPASSFTWTTSAAVTRKRFKNVFVGIAAEPHFASVNTNNKMVKVIQFGKFTADQASASGAIPQALIGLDSANSLLKNDTIIAVQDPTESIGEYARYYGSSLSSNPVQAATTQAEVYIRGSFANVFSRPEQTQKKVACFPLFTIPASASSAIVAATADLLFGGAVEILKMMWIEQVAITVNPLILRFTKNSAGTPVVFASDFNIPTAGAAIGRVATKDYTGEAGRFFNSDDTLDVLTQATAPSAGSGVLYISYRPNN